MEKNSLRYALAMILLWFLFSLVALAMLGLIMFIDYTIHV